MILLPKNRRGSSTNDNIIQFAVTLQFQDENSLWPTE